MNNNDIRFNLMPYINKKFKFQAKFIKSSFSDKYFKEKTYLLHDIKCLNNENLNIDHCWVNNGVEINKIDLKSNNIIQFESKITAYYKHGYGKDKLLDFSLTTPKNIKIL